MKDENGANDKRDKKKKVVSEDNIKALFLQNSFIKKSDKFFESDHFKEKDYIIYAFYLVEIYYRKNVDKKNIKKVVEEELNLVNKYINKMFFLENYLKNKSLNDILENKYLKDVVRKLIINFNRKLKNICFFMAKNIFNIIFESLLSGKCPNKTMLIFSIDEMNSFDYDSFI